MDALGANQVSPFQMVETLAMNFNMTEPAVRKFNAVINQWKI